MQTHRCEAEKKPMPCERASLLSRAHPSRHPSWRRWLLLPRRRRGRPQRLVEHDSARDTRHRRAAVQSPLVRVVALHVPTVEREAHEALYVPRRQLVLVGELGAIGARLEPRQQQRPVARPALPRDGTAVRPRRELGAVFVVADEGGWVLAMPAVVAV